MFVRYGIRVAFPTLMFGVEITEGVEMKLQKGFMFVEPVLLMGMLTSFSMPDRALGAMMVGLSLLAALCQSLQKAPVNRS